jgi:hypothetical protein
MQFLPFLWIKGCYFKDAAEVHVASKIGLQEAVCGSVEKHFEQLYKFWQNHIAIEEQNLKAVAYKGFLVLLESRYGSCSGNF